MIDQPSQVYFPSNSYKKFVEDIEDTEPVLASDVVEVTDGIEEMQPPHEKADDLERTRKIFEMISTVKGGLKDLQFIVLEHADQATWGMVDGIAEAANWRGKSALIPLHW